MDYTQMHAIEMKAWIRRQLMQGPVATNRLWETSASDTTEIDHSTEALRPSGAHELSVSLYRPCLRSQPTSQMQLAVASRNHSKHLLPSSLQLYLATLNKLLPSSRAVATKTSIHIQDVTETCNSQDQYATAHPSSLLPSQSWKTLQARILSLPPEISTMIMTILFTTVFGPRTVHPKTDASVTPMFLSLNKRLCAHYKHIYWSQNTWVVPAGPAHKSMCFMTTSPYDDSITQFSRQTPNTTSFRIRRLELRFSKEDLPSPLWERKFSRRAAPTTNEVVSNNEAKHKETDNPEPRPYDTTAITSLISFDQYKEDCKTLSAALVQLWRDKYDRLTFLDLEYLKLDVRGAVGPDGVFLGREVVEGGLPFSAVGEGRTRVLEVVARTGAEERGVRGAVGEW